MDHAGLPLKTVLEQLDLLGEEVVPVLRKEFAALRPAHVPDGADPRVAAGRRGAEQAAVDEDGDAAHDAAHRWSSSRRG